MQDGPSIPQMPQMPSDPSDIGNWIIYAGGSLVAALITLWKINESKNTKAVQKLEDRIDRIDAARDECERDRQRLAGVCGELQRRVDALETKK